jgi:periplasmic protein TonB
MADRLQSSEEFHSRAMHMSAFSIPHAEFDPGSGFAGGAGSDRLKSALGVAAFHSFLLYLLATGLGVTVTQKAGDNLITFRLTETIAPVEEAPAKVRKSAPTDPEGSASPPNLEAVASPIVALTAQIPLPVPSPLASAPAPAEGKQANAGAAQLPGPGAGAGGEGDGSGAGAAGSGSGGDGIAVQAERIKGRIRGSDYPEGAYRRHASGTVFVRLTVGIDGRVSDCAIDESSGHADLDAATCSLILKRYLYRPARDLQGRPVVDQVNLAQVWETTERR